MAKKTTDSTETKSKTNKTTKKPKITKSITDNFGSISSLDSYLPIKSISNSRDSITEFDYNLIKTKASVKFKKLYDNSPTPEYAHVGDMGVDLKAYSLEYDFINDRYIYGSGLAFESSNGVGAFGLVRSSFSKIDCMLANHVGVLDTATYRGEIMAIFKPKVDTETYLKFEAMKIWDNLPWYKKLKKLSFEKIYQQVRSDFFISKKYLDRAPYKLGEKMLQMVFIQHPEIILEETTELSNTERGEGGFGSTGA